MSILLINILLIVSLRMSNMWNQWAKWAKIFRFPLTFVSFIGLFCKETYIFIDPHKEPEHILLMERNPSTDWLPRLPHTHRHTNQKTTARIPWISRLAAKASAVSLIVDERSLQRADHWCWSTCCSVLQWVAVCCSVLQNAAACCSVLQ